MPAITTTVPAVLNALVALASSVMPTSVAVHDGPPTEPIAPEYLSIGFSADDEVSAVSGSLRDEGNHISSESYNVRCQLSVMTGDMTVGAVIVQRARIASLFALYVAALRADPQLLGALVAGGRADLGQYAWTYGPTSGGTVATIDFDVTVMAGFLGAT